MHPNSCFLLVFDAMRNMSTYDEAVFRLLEYQSLHKMRNTPERQVILKRIVAHSGFFTVKNVVEWVQKDFISKATVYNTLQVLEKAQIDHCLRQQHSTRGLQYELTLGEKNAMQIICTKCGRVSKVKDHATETAIQMKIYPNFIMRRFSVYVFGECKKCKNQLTK